MEELSLTEHEMIWTTRFFMYQEMVWVSRLKDAKVEHSAGHAAFCEKQITMWQEFGRTADSQFEGVSRTYLSCWKPAVAGP